MREVSSLWGKAKANSLPSGPWAATLYVLARYGPGQLFFARCLSCVRILLRINNDALYTQDLTVALDGGVAGGETILLLLQKRNDEDREREKER